MCHFNIFVLCDYLYFIKTTAVLYMCFTRYLAAIKLHQVAYIVGMGYNKKDAAYMDAYAEIIGCIIQVRT
jgi:hypothetical protein